MSGDLGLNLSSVLCQLGNLAQFLSSLLPVDWWQVSEWYVWTCFVNVPLLCKGEGVLSSSCEWLTQRGCVLQSIGYPRVLEQQPGAPHTLQDLEMLMGKWPSSGSDKGMSTACPIRHLSSSWSSPQVYLSTPKKRPFAGLRCHSIPYGTRLRGPQLVEFFFFFLATLGLCCGTWTSLVAACRLQSAWA